MKKTSRSILNRVVSLMLATCLAASPMFGVNALAGKKNADQSKNGAYLVRDDGTEVPISEEKLKVLRGQSTSEKPEDYVLEAAVKDETLVDVKTGEPVAVGAEDNSKDMKLTAAKNVQSITKKASSGGISVVPNYNGVFYVYDTYFNYYPFSLTGNYDALNYTLYLEYSTDGANWTCYRLGKRNLIQLAYDQGYSISGLQPNTTYFTRIFYGYGSYRGAALNTTTIKTGMATAPAVKKVQVKAVKVKHHKVKHYLYGVYMYTEKFYTCRFKVIVKLKKKPGTPGILINGEWAGGNKKKYTKVFIPYPNYYFKNPRKKTRLTVTLRSAQDANWGGYSPEYSVSKKAT